MSEGDVAGRLRELSRLSAAALDTEEGRRDMARRARLARRRAVVDMSGRGVAARIRELASVSQLCASLARARRDRTDPSQSS